MKSSNHIESIIKEMERFFGACDHLKLDDLVIESSFKKLINDHDDGDISSDLMIAIFEMEMIHRDMEKEI